jgi:predicted DNA-binding transcriptional regulator AlpA
MENTTVVSATSLLKLQEVADRLRISIRTLWRMAENNIVPRPIKLGPKSVRWKEAEIVRYIESL